MLYLRKPSQASIADGSITKEKLANGAVDSSKIEDGAIDLTSDKVVGSLPESKLADNAVTSGKVANGAIDLTTAKVTGQLPEGKLADNAVTANKVAVGAVGATKLADNAVDLTTSKVTGLLPNTKLAAISDVEKINDNLITLAKVTDDVRLTPFVGGEEEQSVIGITPTEIVETGFSKVVGSFVPVKLRVIASLKVDGSGNTGYMKIFVDNEIDARMTMESDSADYELVSGEADISDLIGGKHIFKAKIYGSDAGVKVYNDYLEIYFVK